VGAAYVSWLKISNCPSVQTQCHVYLFCGVDKL
jgi:hypothetical protein